MLSMSSAFLFPELHVVPSNVAEFMLDRVPDANEAEIRTAARALYSAPLAERVVSSWKLAEYERRTGNPF